MGLSEDERVARLRALLEREHPWVDLGIGDDAAVLRGGIVLSVDASVEGTHFRRGFASWRVLARRAVVAALSDLAAMGAEPRAVLTSLTLPSDVDDLELHRGVADAADEVGAVVVGGNLASGPHVEIHTTVVGMSDRPLRRTGAAVGDGVWLTGAPGDAALGLHGLLHGTETELADAWRAPRAHIEEGIALRGIATACVDVSDGLLRDLHHLCSASGVGASIRTSDIPRASASVEVATRLGVDPDAMVLSGGEAYVLLFTAPGQPPVGTRIGEVVAEPVLKVDGVEREPAGYDHFAGK